MATEAIVDMYRKSKIGVCLMETLDNMVERLLLSPEQAMKILLDFDMSMAEALKYKTTQKISFKGSLHSYRFYNNVWSLMLKDVTFKIDGSHQENVSSVEIIAGDCDPNKSKKKTRKTNS